MNQYSKYVLGKSNRLQYFSSKYPSFSCKLLIGYFNLKHDYIKFNPTNSDSVESSYR